MKKKNTAILVIALLFICLVTANALCAQKEIVFAGPGGAWKRNVEKFVIKPFEEKFNCKVNYAPGISADNLAKVIASRNNPQIDVLYCGDSQQIQGAYMGLFEKLDEKKIPNLANVYPNLRAEADYNSFNGVNGVGLVYNKEIFKEKGFSPPESVYDLFKPEYSGHVVMDSIVGNYGMGFFILLARVNGGSEKNIGPGFELSKKLSKSVFFFSRSPTDTTRVFQEGTAWIGYWGKVRQAMFAKTGFPMGFVPAKEGIPPNIMGASVVKNSKVTELGYELVNYMLSPEVQANMAKTLFIGPSVQNAKLAPEDAERVIYGTQQIEKLMTIDWLTVMERKAQWLERWNKEIQY